MIRFHHIIFLFVFPVILFSQSNDIEKIASGISAEKYEQSILNIDSLKPGIEKDFWYGAFYAARWNDLRRQIDFDKSKTFFSKLAGLDADTINIIEKYYVAQAIGELSIRMAQRGDWLGAVADSWKSIGLLEDVIDAKPDFIDAKAGIAVFRYWVADRLPIYYWVTFHFSTRNDAIEILQDVAEKGKLNADLALQQLFWIYINDEDYNSAGHIRDIYSQRHPDTRLKKWMDYFLHAHEDKYAEAYSDLSNLEIDYENLEEYSTINMMEILVNKLKYALILNKIDDAKLINVKIKQITLNAFQKENLSGKIKLYKKLREKYSEYIR